MSLETVSQQIKGGLIVSCQALEDEPLHSPFIMSRMAKAALESGATAIRANSIADIRGGSNGWYAKRTATGRKISRDCGNN